MILLLYICDTHTFSIYQTFLPSRRRDCHTTPTINEIFHTPIFITNYTKSVISLFHYHLYIYIAISISFSIFLLFPLSHPLHFFPPSFRYTSVPTISNPIYSNNIYLTLSQINRTALSATKASHNSQIFSMLPPSLSKNLKSSRIIIRLFFRRSAVTPDNITVYAPSDIKTGSS